MSTKQERERLVEKRGDVANLYEISRYVLCNTTTQERVTQQYNSEESGR